MLEKYMVFTNKKKEKRILFSVKKTKTKDYETLKVEIKKRKKRKKRKGRMRQSEVEYVYGRALVPQVFSDSYCCFAGSNDYRNPPSEQ